MGAPKTGPASRSLSVVADLLAPFAGDAATEIADRLTVPLGTVKTRTRLALAKLREALRGMNDVTLYGPEDSAGIVSFEVEGVHPHDVGTILDDEGPEAIQLPWTAQSVGTVGTTKASKSS